MDIREERADDRAGLYRLLVSAFPTAAEADLVERLRESRATIISLVAAAGDEIIGCAVFSRMTAPFPALGLGPVAVAENARRTGLAGKLIRSGIARARDEGFAGIFVLGDPVYYGRFGFRAETAAGFASPYAGPYLMALPLGGELPASRGRVDYADAFAMLD